MTATVRICKEEDCEEVISGSRRLYCAIHASRSYIERRARQKGTRRSRRWREANLERDRRNKSVYYRRRRYGLSPEAFDLLLEYQGGVCAVCRFATSLWHVDHDHEHCDTCRGATTCGSLAAIRGILCGPCNNGTGLTDSIALLRAKAAYLESFLAMGSPLVSLLEVA